MGAVDQTVTFANGQSQRHRDRPDSLRSTQPGRGGRQLDHHAHRWLARIDDLVVPLELRILASDATIPPKIVSAEGTPQGIVLTFNKPMNPVGASNVNNYVVRATKTSKRTRSWAPSTSSTLPLLPVGGATSISTSASTSTNTVPLHAADYDPATNSVTLVPKRKLTYSANRDHRDPGAAGDDFGRVRASVEPWPRSHRPGGEPDRS